MGLGKLRESGLKLWMPGDQWHFLHEAIGADDTLFRHDSKNILTVHSKQNWCYISLKVIFFGT